MTTSWWSQLTGLPPGSLFVAAVVVAVLLGIASVGRG